MAQPMIMQCLFSAFHNYGPDQQVSYFRGTPRFTTFINNDNRWTFLLARTAEPWHCCFITLVMFAHYSHSCREHIILVVSINLTSLNCYPFFRSSRHFCFLFTRNQALISTRNRAILIECGFLWYSSTVPEKCKDSTLKKIPRSLPASYFPV